jgi:hypothetical protein
VSDNTPGYVMQAFYQLFIALHIGPIFRSGLIFLQTLLKVQEDKRQLIKGIPLFDILVEN